MTKTKLLESTSIACTELLTENCVLTHVSQVKRTELNFFLLSSTLLHAHSIYLSIYRSSHPRAILNTCIRTVVHHVLNGLSEREGDDARHPQALHDDLAGIKQNFQKVNKG
jgi:hypothetical protein